MMALFTFEDARNLIQEAYSCFKLVSSTKHVALSPRYLGNIKSGILEQLNSELKLFSEKLNGVLIAYENLRTLRDHGSILDEQPFIHFDVQADFIIFQPSVGNLLKGVVNKLGHDHIGCLVHNCFNASIPKPQNKAKKWPTEDLQIGQEFLFEVVKVYVQNNILSMRGKLTEASLSHKRKRQSMVVSDVMPDSTYSNFDDTVNKTASQSHNSDMPPASHKAKKSKHKTKKRDKSCVSEDSEARQSSNGLTALSGSSFQSEDHSDSSKSRSHKKKSKKHKHKHDESSTPSDMTVQAPYVNTLDHNPLSKVHKHKKHKKHRHNKYGQSKRKSEASMNELETFHTSESMGEASGDQSDITLDSGIGPLSPKLHDSPADKRHKLKRKHSSDPSEVRYGAPVKKKSKQ